MEMDTDDVKNEVSIDSLDETSESLNCNVNNRGIVKINDTLHACIMYS